MAWKVYTGIRQEIDLGQWDAAYPEGNWFICNNYTHKPDGTRGKVKERLVLPSGHYYTKRVDHAD